MYEGQKQYTPHKDAEIYATGRFSAQTPRSRRTSAKLLQTQILLGIDALGAKHADEEFDDGFQGDSITPKSETRSDKQSGRFNLMNDIEKANRKSTQPLAIGILPDVSEEESVETDRGNVPIDKVIAELTPVPKRHQTSDQLLPSKPGNSGVPNYFAKTGMSFSPAGGETVGRPTDDAVDRDQEME